MCVLSREKICEETKEKVLFTMTFPNIYLILCSSVVSYFVILHSVVLFHDWGVCTTLSSRFFGLGDNRLGGFGVEILVWEALYSILLGGLGELTWKESSCIRGRSKDEAFWEKCFNFSSSQKALDVKYKQEKALKSLEILQVECVSFRSTPLTKSKYAAAASVGSLCACGADLEKLSL